MSLLQPLLRTDPASPRLTVYNETTGARMEFSATTLDNWANKIGNMLLQEFDADDDTQIRIDLPISWQSAVIPLGIYNAGGTPLFTGDDAEIVFTTVENFHDWSTTDDVVVVSDDPFGRGIEESGGELPLGAVDFSPTARFYGDQFYGQAPALADFAQPDVTDERYLINGWSNKEEFDRRIMSVLAADGSVVVVTGMASTDRLAEIAQMEKVTHQLGDL
ncbi:TIGR03089 family protein [Corynebacterium lubricantis]|uniref:TIGR03089 family protein n=1 Tax=Corynebacterium lubricantis TaxID=541095 RepID=UPI00036CA2D6|nr:TIGR03089 family protein [Corynebacterium lubricantis]